MAYRTAELRRRARKRLTQERTLRRRLLITRCIMIWEALSSALWAPAAVVAGFIALAWTDLLPNLPGLVHATLLAVTGSAAAFLFWRGAKVLRLPSRNAARARLEQTSGFVHRPVTAVGDTLSNRNNPVSQDRLWQAHKAQAAQIVANARIGAARSTASAEDRFGLRVLPVLGLCFTAILAWGDMLPRLERAVLPAFGSSNQTVDVQLWITPPDYTGAAPVFQSTGLSVKDEADQPIAVPYNSVARINIVGASSTPSVRLGAEIAPLNALETGSFEASMTLDRSAPIHVAVNRRRLPAWNIEIIADTPPSVAFTNQVTTSGEWFVSVPYRADDDYGVQTVRLHVSRPQESRPWLKGADRTISLSLPPKDVANFSQTASLDLSDHPWAGDQVTLQLSASDAADQSAESDLQTVTLPERRFTNPAAQIVAEARKSIVHNPIDHSTPAVMLDSVLDRKDTFENDPIAFLTLSTARSVIAKSGALEDFEMLLDMLWNTALRLEDGQRAVAERALQQAEQDLREALQSDADADTLRQAMQAYEEAVQDYLSAMMQDASSMPDIMMNNLALQNMQIMSPTDLSSMLEQLKALSDAGARDAAQQMLSQMQAMLDQMRGMRSGQPQPNENVAALQNLMEQLQSLSDQQSELLNDTFEAQRQENIQRPSDTERAQQRTAEQSALRRQLGAIMSEIGELTGQVPGGLGEAETAMRQAERALSRGDNTAASNAQARAVDALRQGLRQTAESALQAMAQAGGFGLIRMPGFMGQQTDPLGRRVSPMSDQSVTIPDEAAVQRSREILEELRERSRDRTRSNDEREYLRRLLKQF